MRIFHLIYISTLISSAAMGDTRSTRIIYGNDNRIETFEGTLVQKKIAQSSAGMFSKNALIDIDESHVMLNPLTLEDSYGLCPVERFITQPVAADCSGFLVSPDMMVTAAHCVSEQRVCDESVWVFDYKVNRVSKRANIIHEKSKLYECGQVIDTKFFGAGQFSQDYSVIKLKRFVKDRKPLKYRKKNMIKSSAEVYMIGHPTGLPQKITNKGKITNNKSKHFFETTLDSYGGNSGSPVFNSKTNLVEGILVRGGVDFIIKDCGYVSNKVTDDIVEVGNDEFLGEAINRITDIEILNKKDHMFNLAKKGRVSELKKLLLQKSFLGVTDNKGNTLLHIASKYQKTEMVKFLIFSGIELDAQNLKEETALHLGAYVGSHSVINALISSGANLLIKDKYNKRPSGRTPYLSFRLRQKLKNLEHNQLVKQKNRSLK